MCIVQLARHWTAKQLFFLVVVSIHCVSSTHQRHNAESDSPSGVSISPAPSPQALPASFSYSMDCFRDCPSDVLSALGDDTAFCAAEERECVMDCLTDDSFLSGAEMHCACETGMLFASYSYSFDMTGDIYCCGKADCKAAVVDSLLALGNIEVSREFLIEALDDQCLT
jgi:hypothetical protein